MGLSGRGVAVRTAGLALLAAACAGLGGCGLLGDKSNIEPPAELVDFDATLNVRQVWSRRIGDGTERLRLGLSPSTDGARIYAAANDGTVAALDADTGRPIWSVDTEHRLSAGPAYGGGLLVVGSSDGQLIALEADSGAMRWIEEVGSEVLAAPAIGSGTVVFRSVDGRLRGLSAANGAELWTVEQTMPTLTLRGNTVPRVTGTVVVSGFDNGRVGAYTLADGSARWEMALAAPSGRTELDRLVDISTGLQVAGNDVYAASYQGRAVGIDLVTGLVIWQRELSSFAGLGVDASNVYVTDDVGAVIALGRRNGNVLWRQEALRLRDVTAPVRFGLGIVVGDYEGYLHWLDPSDGHFLARVKAVSGAISNPPIVVGTTLYVQGDGGTVAAFTVADQEA